jgi:hypothetical protein
VEGAAGAVSVMAGVVDAAGAGPGAVSSPPRPRSSAPTATTAPTVSKLPTATPRRARRARPPPMVCEIPGTVGCTGGSRVRSSLPNETCATGSPVVGATPEGVPCGVHCPPE